jgi:hypothetical protein
MLVKTNRKKELLTPGEFIMAVYDAWGKRRARGIIRLAVNTRLVEFRRSRPLYYS